MKKETNNQMEPGCDLGMRCSSLFICLQRGVRGTGYYLDIRNN